MGSSERTHRKSKGEEHSLWTEKEGRRSSGLQDPKTVGAKRRLVSRKSDLGGEKKATNE